MIKLLKTADRVLEKLLNALTILPFMGMVILVACQVYTRFCTESSLTWSEELSRYLMAYMVFFAAVLVARDNTHIRIENFSGRLTGIPKKLLSTVSILIQMAFLGLVILGYFRFFPTASMRTSATNHIPMSLVYLCIPLSCALMLLYLVRDLVLLFCGKLEEGRNF